MAKARQARPCPWTCHAPACRRHFQLCAPYSVPLTLRSRYLAGEALGVKGTDLPQVQTDVSMNWSGRRESNPHLLLGRQGSYHYTTPAHANRRVFHVARRVKSHCSESPGLGLRAGRRGRLERSEGGRVRPSNAHKKTSQSMQNIQCAS